MNVEHLLIHTVHVASVTSKGAKGAAVFGAPVAVRARVLERRGVADNAQGEAITTSHLLQLTHALSPNDRVWLPGTSTSDASAAKTPISITAFPSLTGDVTLYEVTLG